MKVCLETYYLSSLYKDFILKGSCNIKMKNTHTSNKDALWKITYSALKVNFLFHFLLLNNIALKRKNFLHWEQQIWGKIQLLPWLGTQLIFTNKDKVEKNPDKLFLLFIPTAHFVLPSVNLSISSWTVPSYRAPSQLTN